MATLIPVLRHNPGVLFDRIAPGGFRILAALDGLVKVLGQDIYITSATDSHRIGAHPRGEAYDIGVKRWTLPMIEKALRFLRQTLGERFYSQYEVPITPTDAAEVALAVVNPQATGPHLHVQVRKGLVYPPEAQVPYPV